MKTKSDAESFQREKLVVRSEDDFRRFAKSTAAKAMAANLKAKGAGPSSADLEEIPELTSDELASARRAVPKVSVTSRLDADVVEWLKAGGGKYQTRMNRILRAVMNRSKQRSGVTDVALRTQDRKSSQSNRST